MPLDLIIGEVKTILSAVAGIGKVHAYERWIETEAQFRDLFVDGARICGWTITREATPARDVRIHELLRRHQVVMRGYMGVSDHDATENTFQALVETVFATFSANRKLNGKAYYCDPVQVRTVGHRRFAGVVCHYTELMLEAQEYPIDF